MKDFLYNLKLLLKKGYEFQVTEKIIRDELNSFFLIVKSEKAGETFKIRLGTRSPLFTIELVEDLEEILKEDKFKKEISRLKDEIYELRKELKNESK